MLSEEQVRELLTQLRQQRENMLLEINRQLGLLDGQIAALEHVLTPVDAPKAVEMSGE
jgi:hypothetical protein